MARVLVIDDDSSFREVLSFALTEEGHQVEAYATGEAGLSAVASNEPEVVLSDLKMPGMDGMEVLRRLQEIDSTIPVIMLTAFGSIEEAVKAMRCGAHDYLTKPYNRDELKLALERSLERRRLLLENQTLRAQLRDRTQGVEIVHASPAMRKILELIKRIAPTDATVLITGESGTGKQVIANALHAHSERWDRSLVAVDCASIPRELMESELFGYVRGAFTGAIKNKSGKFQRADGGTLFLDEIGDLPPDLQTKLLRAIETREIDVIGGQRPVPVDVRIIAATNADLAARVHDGVFRSDLYYRLNVIPIHIPPLRERKEDIPVLWDHFVQKFSGQPLRSTPELMRNLLRLPWPGNARELANTCQRMVLLRSSDLLTEKDLPADQGEQLKDGGSGSGDFLGHLPEDHLSLPGVEREIIVRALFKHDGNRTRTAEYLGIPRHVLLYRLEKFGIE